MSPNNSALNCMHGGSGYGVLLCDFVESPCIRADGNNINWGESTVAIGLAPKNDASMLPESVPLVFRSTIPPEVCEIICAWISVVVASLAGLVRRRAAKCNQDKSVQREGFVNPIPVESHFDVTIARLGTVNHAAGMPSLRTESAANHTFAGPHSPKVGDLVDSFISRDREPLFKSVHSDIMLERRDRVDAT